MQAQLVLFSKAWFTLGLLVHWSRVRGPERERLGACCACFLSFLHTPNDSKDTQCEARLKVAKQISRFYAGDCTLEIRILSGIDFISFTKVMTGVWMLQST